MDEARDEAKDMGSEKGSSRLIWLLALCCFVLGCSQQYILGVPDQVAATLGISLGQVSLLMTAFGLINAFLAPVIVMLTARYSARVQLLIGLACMAVGLLMTAVTSIFPLQMVARGIMGMGNGAFVATAYSASQKLAAPGKQASAMANVALGFSAASVLAMPIARALRESVNWQNAYLVIAIFAVAAFLVIAKVFPNTAPDTEDLTVKQRLAPLANKAVMFAYAGTTFMVCAFACFYTYVTPFLDAFAPQFNAYLSIVLLVVGLMSMLGTKLHGWLADRAGLRTAIMTSFICSTLSLLLIFFCEGAGLGLVGALCLYQLFAWAFLPVQNTLLASIAGDGARMAIALSSSFLQLGNAIGAAIAGIAVSSAPFGALPLIAFPFALLAIAAEVTALTFAAKKMAK